MQWINVLLPNKHIFQQGWNFIRPNRTPQEKKWKFVTVVTDVLECKLGEKNHIEQLELLIDLPKDCLISARTFRDMRTLDKHNELCWSPTVELLWVESYCVNYNKFCEFSISVLSCYEFSCIVRCIIGQTQLYYMSCTINLNFKLFQLNWVLLVIYCIVWV